MANPPASPPQASEMYAAEHHLESIFSPDSPRVSSSRSVRPFGPTLAPLGSAADSIGRCAWTRLAFDGPP